MIERFGERMGSREGVGKYRFSESDIWGESLRRIFENKDLSR